MNDDPASEARIRDLDLSGLKCPLPVLRTRKILQRMRPGERIRLTCTDPLTIIDIPNLVRDTGNILVAHGEEKGKLHFVIQRSAKPETPKGPARAEP
ncbi:sulfurtransferase TusA family protein [Microvirga brassicacearum]|uniref:Sulfurtransferase TusA family protein n=1 Tax=Microvirga brassicacearum TaxID=2580413 RepID=A0A5N3P6F4_9HYPH|nr:sulfurtransferase TusA family protein [Microvirga brassicacearum]KAB0265318.1 sulfurtransferase TusA family protein [Microvirga brassicacearum]